MSRKARESELIMTIHSRGQLTTTTTNDGSGGKRKRVSRKAKELELMMLLIMLLLVMLIIMMEVKVSISFSFVEIRIFDADFGRQIGIVDPSRVESIGKRSILCVKTLTSEPLTKSYAS